LIVFYVSIDIRDEGRWCSAKFVKPKQNKGENLIEKRERESEE